MDDSAEVTNWIRLSRKLARSDLWLQDPFSRGQAWVDLLMLANWKDGSVRIRGVRIDLKRGQLAASSIWLSERWKWSRGKIQRFLDELQIDQRIVQQKTNVTNVLTILNYDSYQKTDSKQDNKQNSKRTANDTANGQQTDTQEEGIRRVEGSEEGKEGTKNSPPSPPRGNARMTPEEFVERWNAFFKDKPKIPQVRRLTAKRRKWLIARLKDDDWLDTFKVAITQMPLGETTEHTWQPNFDWLVRDDNNAGRLAEGEFKWRNADDPARERRQANLRKIEAEQREQRLAEEKQKRRLQLRDAHSAIESILDHQDGNGESRAESNLLSGLDLETSSVSGVEQPSHSSEDSTQRGI